MHLMEVFFSLFLSFSIVVQYIKFVKFSKVASC